MSVEIQYFDAVIPDRTLPTPEQSIEICRILHSALVIIRNFGFSGGNVEIMKEIAETLHETPVEMFNPNSWDWNTTLDRLRNLEEKYPEVRAYQMARRFEEIYGKG